MTMARIGIWLAVTTLVVTAALKLISGEADDTATRYLLDPGSMASRLVGLAELGLAAMLVVDRTRRAAAILLTVFLCVGAVWVTSSVVLSGPSCGCFGNVIELDVGWQLLLSGTLIALLAPVCHADSLEAGRQSPVRISDAD